jgi:hypothetical protein
MPLAQFLHALNFHLMVKSSIRWKLHSPAHRGEHLEDELEVANLRCRPIALPVAVVSWREEPMAVPAEPQLLVVDLEGFKNFP